MIGENVWDSYIYTRSGAMDLPISYILKTKNRIAEIDINFGTVSTFNEKTYEQFKNILSTFKFIDE